MRRCLMITAAAMSAAALASCSDTIRQSSAAAPTVSYAYSIDDDPEDVASTADAYCDDTYDQRAVLVTRDAQGDRYEATYSCE